MTGCPEIMNGLGIMDHRQFFSGLDLGFFLIPGTGRGNPPSWDFLQPGIFLETWDLFGKFCEIF